MAVKETLLTQAVKNVIDIKLKAIDVFIETYVEPLLDVGNPEKLIGKKYEEWTPQDLQYLSQIYGEKLEDYIFKKSYKEVKKLEEEEKNLV